MLLSTLLSSVRSTFRTCDKLARARYANIDKYTSPSWFSIKNEPCRIRPSFHRFRPSTEIFYVTHRLFHRALLLFFSLPRSFFSFFFFFEADKTNIFQAKSVAVGENLQPSFSKTNHARVVVCQPFHLGHCPINNNAIRFDYFPLSPSIRF